MASRRLSFGPCRSLLDHGSATDPQISGPKAQATVSAHVHNNWHESKRDGWRHKHLGWCLAPSRYLHTYSCFTHYLSVSLSVLRSYHGTRSDGSTGTIAGGRLPCRTVLEVMRTTGHSMAGSAEQAAQPGPWQAQNYGNMGRGRVVQRLLRLPPLPHCSGCRPCPFPAPLWPRVVVCSGWIPDKKPLKLLKQLVLRMEWTFRKPQKPNKLVGGLEPEPNSQILQLGKLVKQPWGLNWSVPRSWPNGRQVATWHWLPLNANMHAVQYILAHSLYSLLGVFNIAVPIMPHPIV